MTEFVHPIFGAVHVEPVPSPCRTYTLAADLQEFIYRVASQVPFEHAAWANERGAALLDAVKRASAPAEPDKAKVAAFKIPRQIVPQQIEGHTVVEMMRQYTDVDDFGGNYEVFLAAGKACCGKPLYAAPAAVAVDAGELPPLPELGCDMDGREYSGYSASDMRAYARATLRATGAAPADAEDAARYRWLRDIRQSRARNGLILDPYDLDGTLLCGEELDAAIDTARAASQPAQGEGK